MATPANGVLGNGDVRGTVAAPASSEPPAAVFTGTGKEIDIGKLGCVVPKGNIARVGLATSPEACAELCYQQGYPFLGLGLGLEDKVCWCVDDASGMASLGGPGEGPSGVECTFKQAAGVQDQHTGGRDHRPLRRAGQAYLEHVHLRPA